jgi:drug/metabolite transporter (DMT)-like permease
MSLANIALYITTVLIWGSTWFVITFQLGSVSPELSVAYRFALAALISGSVGFGLGWYKSINFSLKDHFFIALQGIFLFCLNYWFFYQATAYLPSGLVAVSFSTITIMNMINANLFLKTRIRIGVVAASLLGLLGIFFVFLPEFSNLNFNDLSDNPTFKGLGLCAIATYLASLGNIISVRNQKSGIPVMAGNAIGMGYGAIVIFGIAMFNGLDITFDTNFDYLWSMAYLAIFGSVIAFGCYLTLIGRIGAERGAYAAVLFPIVALGISTVFEGYIWTYTSLAGVGLILLGNMVILTPGVVSGLIKKCRR